MPASSTALIRKTILFLLAGVAVLVAIVVASLWLATRIDVHSEELYRTREIARTAREILIAATDAEIGQRGYLMTGDRKYLEPYSASHQRLLSEFGKLEALMADDVSIKPVLDDLGRLVRGKLAELAETIELSDAGRREAALDILRSDRGKRIMDSLRSSVADLIGSSERRLVESKDDLDASTRALNWVGGLGLIFVLLVAAGVVWIVVRYTREALRARQEIEALNLGLEARVADRTTALAHANDEIQRFAYIVSHDLRAPLVNIVGFTGELEAGVATLRRFVDGASTDAPNPVSIAEARAAAHEDLPEATRFIRASTTKMDALINAILRLARDGRRALVPEPIDIEALVAKVLATLEHQLGAAQATVDVVAPLPRIVSDRLALEQIFGNLIDNAVKYLHPDRPGRITISARTSGAAVVVEVADNGRGIASKDHERIFELFRRSGRQDRPGEGMGLTHVRALARRLGGDIQVQSALGEGAKFQVRLPRSLPTT